jgi:hypothetical protein
MDRGDKPLHSLLSDREFQPGKLAAGRSVGDRPRVVPVREDREHLPTRILEKMHMKSNGPYQLFQRSSSSRTGAMVR